MPVCQIVNSPAAKQTLLLPVSGAGSNVPAGTLLIPGSTGGTNFGVAIPAAATSAGILGLLGELHTFSKSGDATTSTIVDWFQENGQLGSGNVAFPSHPVELLGPVNLLRIDYDLSTTVVSLTSATATVLSITSEESNFDGGWVYVSSGTGKGQLCFVKSSGATSITIGSGIPVTLDSTSKLVKILPYFYATPNYVVNSTTVPTQLGSLAAAGSGSGVCVGQYMERNTNSVRLNPKSHNNLASLNTLNQLAFWSLMSLSETVLVP